MKATTINLTKMQTFIFKNNQSGEIRPVSAQSLTQARAMLSDFIGTKYTLIEENEEDQKKD